MANRKRESDRRRSRRSKDAVTGARRMAGGDGPSVVLPAPARRGMPSMTSSVALQAMLAMRGIDAGPVADWPAADSPDVPDLLARARDAGLALQAARLTLRELGQVSLPVIGRADDGAFFVVEAIDPDGIRCRWAADGVSERVAADTFVAVWSGVIVSIGSADAGAMSSLAADGRDPGGVVPTRPVRQRRAAAGWIRGLAAAGVLVGAIVAWLAVSTVAVVIEATGSMPLLVEGEAVTAPVAGTLAEVLVADGRTVVPGEVVARIRVTTHVPQQVDVADLVEARVMIARADAMLAAVAIGEAPVLPAVADLDPIRRTVEQQHLVARYDEHRGRLAGIRADLQQRRVERVAAEEQVAGAGDALVGARKAEAEGRHLYEQGFISRNAATERAVRREAIERDLERHRKTIEERTRAIVAGEARLASVRDELQATLRAEREEGVSLLARLEAPLPPRIVAEDHDVVAPMAGRVQDVGEKGAGRDVARGDPLFTIRTPAGPFELEVSLDPSAAARVRPGQAARAVSPAGEREMQVAQVSVQAGRGSPGDAPVVARLRAITGAVPTPDETASGGWTVTIHAGTETRLARLLRPGP